MRASHVFSVRYWLSGNPRGLFATLGAENRFIYCVFINILAKQISHAFSSTYWQMTFCHIVRPLFSETYWDHPSFLMFFGAEAPGTIFMDKLPLRPAPLPPPPPPAVRIALVRVLFFPTPPGSWTRDLSAFPGPTFGPLPAQRVRWESPSATMTAALPRAVGQPVDFLAVRRLGARRAGVVVRGFSRNMAAP